MVAAVRSAQHIIKELNRATATDHPEEDDLLRRFPTAIVNLVQHHLLNALAAPDPDPDKIKTWFTLLVRSRRLDLLERKTPLPPSKPAEKSAEEKMEMVWDMWALPESERIKRRALWRDFQASSPEEKQKTVEDLWHETKNAASKNAAFNASSPDCQSSPAPSPICSELPGSAEPASASSPLPHQMGESRGETPPNSNFAHCAPEPSSASGSLSHRIGEGWGEGSLVHGEGSVPAESAGTANPGAFLGPLRPLCPSPSVHEVPPDYGSPAPERTSQEPNKPPAEKIHPIIHEASASKPRKERLNGKKCENPYPRIYYDVR